MIANSVSRHLDNRFSFLLPTDFLNVKLRYFGCRYSPNFTSRHPSICRHCSYSFRFVCFCRKLFFLWRRSFTVFCLSAMFTFIFLDSKLRTFGVLSTLNFAWYHLFIYPDYACALKFARSYRHWCSPTIFRF